MTTKHINGKKVFLTVLIHLFLMSLVLIILLPMCWLIMNSLKTNQEMFRDSIALPATPLFSNWVNAWNKGLYNYFLSSIITSAMSLCGILVFSSLLAYGLTRLNLPGSGLIFVIVLGGMALSEQVALVPLFKI